MVFLFLPYDLISTQDSMKSCHKKEKKEEILLNFHRSFIMSDLALAYDLLPSSWRISLTIA